MVVITNYTIQTVYTVQTAKLVKSYSEGNSFHIAYASSGVLNRGKEKRHT